MIPSKLGVYEKVVTLQMLQFLIPELASYIRMYGLPVVIWKLKGYFHLLEKEANKRSDLKNEVFEIGLWIDACLEATQSLGNANLPDPSYGNDVFSFFFTNGARVFPPLGNICDALRSRP